MLQCRHEAQNLSGFDFSKFAGEQKRKGEILMYLTKERKLVEALHIGNIENISKNLRRLLEEGKEDIVIIVLREAIASDHLVACSKAAAVIGGIVLDAKPQRVMLSRLGEQINNPVNASLGSDWVDIVLATDTGLSIEQWIEAWSRNEDVRAVRKLFKQAPYSSAIDEFCRPVDPYQPDDYPENTGDRIVPELVFD